MIYETTRLTFFFQISHFEFSHPDACTQAVHVYHDVQFDCFALTNRIRIEIVSASGPLELQEINVSKGGGKNGSMSVNQDKVCGYSLCHLLYLGTIISSSRENLPPDHYFTFDNQSYFRLSNEEERKNQENKSHHFRIEKPEDTQVVLGIVVSLVRSHHKAKGR